MTFDYDVSDKLKIKISKLAKKDRKKAEIVQKKIKEIINNDAETIKRVIEQSESSLVLEIQNLGPEPIKTTQNENIQMHNIDLYTDRAINPESDQFEDSLDAGQINFSVPLTYDLTLDVGAEKEWSGKSHGEAVLSFPSIQIHGAGIFATILKPGVRLNGEGVSVVLIDRGVTTGDPKNELLNRAKDEALKRARELLKNRGIIPGSEKPQGEPTPESIAIHRLRAEEKARHTPLEFSATGKNITVFKGFNVGDHQIGGLVKVDPFGKDGGVTLAVSISRRIEKKGVQAFAGVVNRGGRISRRISNRK